VGSVVDIASATIHHHQPINVPTARAQAFLMDHPQRTVHNPPRGPSADWWVITTANVARVPSMSLHRVILLERRLRLTRVLYGNLRL
jgi:negative regulator of replication initiation